MTWVGEVVQADWDGHAALRPGSGTLGVNGHACSYRASAILQRPRSRIDHINLKGEGVRLRR